MYSVVILSDCKYFVIHIKYVIKTLNGYATIQKILNIGEEKCR